MRLPAFLCLSLVIVLLGCSQNESVHIDLPPGIHLEDTTAGGFLKELRINYKDDLSFLRKIRESLNKYAVLEDEYLEGNKGIGVKRWQIHQGFILYEKFSTDNLWFEYPLGSSGIHYEVLVGGQSIRQIVSIKLWGKRVSFGGSWTEILMCDKLQKGRQLFNSITNCFSSERHEEATIGSEWHYKRIKIPIKLKNPRMNRSWHRDLQSKSEFVTFLAKRNFDQ